MTRRFIDGCLVVVLAVVCLAALFAPASAQTCHGAIDTLNFGTIDLTANIAYDTSGTVSVTCSGTAGATVRVCPSVGAGSGGMAGGGNPRTMTNGAILLQYNLFKDAGRTTIWGAYTGPNSPLPIDVTLNAGGTGSASVPVYGRVFAGQTTLPALTYQSIFSGAESSISYDYIAAGTCAAIGAAHQTAGPFAVTANDSNSCTISAAALNFGNIATTAANTDSTATVTVACSTGTAYTVSLDGGLTGATDPTQRYMLNGANQLRYGLYRNPARSQPWGATAGVDTQGGTGDGAPNALTVYGRVPIQTTPSIGAYRDFVIVTVTY